MKEIGIVRCIDKLGRLVIPKELRDMYNLNYDIEIIPCEEGILLRNPKYTIELVEIKSTEK